METEILRQAASIPQSTLHSGSTFRDIAAANINQSSMEPTTAEINYINALQQLHNNEIGCIAANTNTN